jgi:hypothetical protein
MDGGINIAQLRRYVIRPALQYIGLHAANSENLIVGTALVESAGRHLKQVGRGPALGMWQMEPVTHSDIWDNWLRYKPDLAARVNGLQTQRADDFQEELIGNLFYAAAMCRVFYRRLPDTLPDDQDYEGMARLWKLRYNTYLGAGTVEKAIPYFRVACAFEGQP